MDVRAFDQDYDGGENSQEESASASQEEFEAQTQNAVLDDFRELHYSRPEDIPREPFSWAGKTFDFGSKRDPTVKLKETV